MLGMDPWFEEPLGGGEMPVPTLGTFILDGMLNRGLLYVQVNVALQLQSLETCGV